MIVIRKKEDVEPKFNLYYSRLAEFMVRLVDIQSNSVILEAGCGTGALTVPLLSLLDSCSVYVCYDLYAGVYEKSLQKIIKKEPCTNIIMGDVRAVSFRINAIDIIFSNELLCELTRNGAEKAVQEFYRILKPGGYFIHGVLSPYPENRSQELVILADTYSAEPVFPKEWFSPPADELAGMLHQTGFSAIHVSYFEECVRFEGEIAFETVQKWVTKPEFFEKYSEDLEKYGLEYPMEQVVCCQK